MKASLILAVLILTASCANSSGESSSPLVLSATTSTFQPATSVAAVELRPAPSCFAYTGTGDLKDVDLVLYCMAGVDLIRAVDSCEETGNRPDYCLRWATSPESDGGAGITGFSESELDLAFRLGQNRLTRGEFWEADFDFCVETHGEDACRSAITDEREFFYP